MEDLATDAAADVGGEPDVEGEPDRQRQCGRCQLMFPADAGLHPSAQVGWWLCPPCRESLTGRQSAGRF